MHKNRWPPQEERFWSKVKKTIDCWLWNGRLNRKVYGYGNINYDGRAQPAHRVSWQIHNGPIPKGMKVLHSCDVPICVNPKHLFLGTQADNIHDMYKKKRNNNVKGERVHSAVLTEQDVIRIRKLRSRYSLSHLAALYSMSKGHIGKIINRQRWKHI